MKLTEHMTVMRCVRWLNVPSQLPQPFSGVARPVTCAILFAEHGKGGREVAASFVVGHLSSAHTADWETLHDYPHGCHCQRSPTQGETTLRLHSSDFLIVCDMTSSYQ